MQVQSTAGLQASNRMHSLGIYSIYELSYSPKICHSVQPIWLYRHCCQTALEGSGPPLQAGVLSPVRTLSMLTGQ